MAETNSSKLKIGRNCPQKEMNHLPIPSLQGLKDVTLPETDIAHDNLINLLVNTIFKWSIFHCHTSFTRGGFPKMVVPPKHPKMIIFSRKTPWLCWVPTTILGNTQRVSFQFFGCPKKPPKVAPFHMAANVNDLTNEMTFLYKFLPGLCPASHGHNVAKIAGLPEKAGWFFQRCFGGWKFQLGVKGLRKLK